MRAVSEAAIALVVAAAIVLLVVSWLLPELDREEAREAGEAMVGEERS